LLNIVATYGQPIAYEQTKCSIRHRTAALGHEHERTAGPLLAFQPPQRTQLLARDRRMLGVTPLLVAAHRDQRFIKIDLVPPQADQLAHAQTMPKAHHDHRPITVTISTSLASSFGERLDLGLG
jgi:hypothetical protein